MVPEVVSGGSIHHVLASSLSELAIVAATRGTGAQLIFRGLFISRGLQLAHRHSERHRRNGFFLPLAVSHVSSGDHKGRGG